MSLKLNLQFTPLNEASTEGNSFPYQEEIRPSPPDSEICWFRAYQFFLAFPILQLYNIAKHRMYAIGCSVDENCWKHNIKWYLHPTKTKNIVCPAQATIQWWLQASRGHAITIGWLINVKGYLQSAEQRPSATLNASTAYQALPIVKDAFLEDNSAFVSYILVKKFGE